MENQQTFVPRLDILPSAQCKLWSEFTDLPDSFTLYGGTAIALQLGHRQSVDFDFFSTDAFDPDALYETLPFLKDQKIIQKHQNTLTCLVDRGDPVMCSFFGLQKIKPILPPLMASDTKVKIATLIDLAGMKAAVIQKRAEMKDYMDIFAIITSNRIDLPHALSAAQSIDGPNFNPEITLKALSYFEDGDLNKLPPHIKDKLAEAVREVDLDHLPKNILTDQSN